MTTAFTTESADGAPDEVAPAALVLPPGTRNYVTPAGLAAYHAELAALDAAAAAPAAAPADAPARARAARRKAALAQRLELAEVIDPAAQPTDVVRFGHAVAVDTPGGPRVYHIVGLDETDPRAGRISWLSPIAAALLGSKVGEVVTVVQAGREAEWEITGIHAP